MPAKPRTVFVVVLSIAFTTGLLSSCGFHRKYENPITADTQQPDKILFDKAIKDMERGRYAVARLTLQTLVSTYDTSEYLAKAKLAIADSWFREGGGGGLANAEAEYKDFILFYPTLDEAAEAQEKVCMLHYRQMEKPDRDVDHARRADEECRALLVNYPNSKFAPQGEQLLRNIQEVLAEAEYRTGAFYYSKGSWVAAANRLKGLTEHYPLFSKADEALWKLGDAWSRLGPRFADQSADAYARIVRDYPLSPYAEGAKKRLLAMERPVPEADPVAMARMKYELANLTKPGIMSHFWGIFRKSPDTSMAAKAGAPAADILRPTLPITAAGQLPGEGEVGAEVTVAPITGPSALDTKPDARRRPPDSAEPKPE